MIKTLRLVTHLALSIATSAAGLWFFGIINYVIIGVLVAVVSMGVFVNNTRALQGASPDQLQLPESQTKAIDTITQLGVASWFGVTWPSLPLVVWIGWTV